MDGLLQRDLRDRLGVREGEGDEAFHVRRATGVTACRRAESSPTGSVDPGLAVDRHDIGVAREDDTAGNIRTEAGPEIGFRAILAGHAHEMCAHRAQKILDPFDQRQVGVAGRGVEGDEAGENVADGGKRCHGPRLAHSPARGIDIRGRGSIAGRMIEFHAGNGPDTQAVGIALEEMFFDYRVMPGRAPLPVIALGGGRVVGASNIVMALARKTGRFLVAPEDAAPWLATPVSLDALEAQLGDPRVRAGRILGGGHGGLSPRRACGRAQHPAIARWAERMSRRSGVGRGMGVIVR